MTDATVLFTVSGVPFDYVQAATVTIADASIRITSNDHAMPIAVQSPESGYRYTVAFLLNDGHTYTLPTATANANEVFIPSPFRVETVAVNVILQADGHVVQDLSLKALHAFAGIGFLHQWNDLAATSQPWTLITTASAADFLVRYVGEVSLADGTRMPIPGSVTKRGVINVSPIQFGFTVIVDPSSIQWQTPVLNKVVVSVFQLNAQNQMVDIQSAVFDEGSSQQPQYLEYLAYYDVGIVYYFDAEYWYAGEPQPRKLPVTEESTAQTIQLPAGVAAG